MSTPLFGVAVWSSLVFHGVFPAVVSDSDCAFDCAVLEDALCCVCYFHNNSMQATAGVACSFICSRQARRA